MVSAQISKPAGKPFHNHVLLPLQHPNVISLNDVDLDFSDIFGPAPAQGLSSENVAVAATNGFIYEEPAVIYCRSHSFVGPTNYVSQSLKLSKLTLRENEHLLELVEGDSGERNDHLEEATLEAAVTDKSEVHADVSIPRSVGLDDFEVLKVVGQGAFAKVYQVRKIGTSEIFAMKVMRKDKILEKDHVEYMKTERDVLTKIDHPFVVTLRYSFQTKHRLYLVLDFVNGGHLFFHLHRQGLFREDLARIYAAEIVSAVSHLHCNGIMHRDLKPENILLDADGHVLLTDFGLAKQFDESTRSNSLCGTIEYMAPEIVLSKGHDKAADWWSVGVLLYEMLTGKPPFVGGNRQKVQQKIIKDKIKLPAFLSSDAHSLLKGNLESATRRGGKWNLNQYVFLQLLHKEASKRLGSGLRGCDEIKNHKWFGSINWKKLDAREIQPSFCPQVSGKLCVAKFEEQWTSMPLLDSPAASPKSGENPFKGFSYVRPTVEE